MESRFKNKVDALLERYLTEAPQGTPDAPPMPDPSGESEADPNMPDPNEVTPADAVDEIYKNSKKPWIDLANVLAQAMFYDFTDEQIQEINNRMSTNNEVAINVEDFRDYLDNESKGINDGLNPQDDAVKGAAIRVFEIVKDVMASHKIPQVVRAEYR